MSRIKDQLIEEIARISGDIEDVKVDNVKEIYKNILNIENTVKRTGVFSEEVGNYLSNINKYLENEIFFSSIENGQLIKNWNSNFSIDTYNKDSVIHYSFHDTLEIFLDTKTLLAPSQDVINKLNSLFVHWYQETEQKIHEQIRKKITPFAIDKLDLDGISSARRLFLDSTDTVPSYLDIDSIGYSDMVADARIANYFDLDYSASNVERGNFGVIFGTRVTTRFQKPELYQLPKGYVVLSGRPDLTGNYVKFVSATMKNFNSIELNIDFYATIDTKYFIALELNKNELQSKD